MINLSNYPDDIERYSNDPRSPLYNGPDAKPSTELATELMALMGDRNAHMSVFAIKKIVIERMFENTVAGDGMFLAVTKILTDPRAAGELLAAVFECELVSYIDDNRAEIDALIEDLS